MVTGNMAAPQNKNKTKKRTSISTPPSKQRFLPINCEARNIKEKKTPHQFQTSTSLKSHAHGLQDLRTGPAESSSSGTAQDRAFFFIRDSNIVCMFIRSKRSQKVSYNFNPDSRLCTACMIKGKKEKKKKKLIEVYTYNNTRVRNWKI